MGTAQPTTNSSGLRGARRQLPLLFAAAAVCIIGSVLFSAFFAQCAVGSQPRLKSSAVYPLHLPQSKRLLFLGRICSWEAAGVSRMLLAPAEALDSSKPDRHSRTPFSQGRGDLQRLLGFSLLLSPEAATTEQELEKMYADAIRQFARLWAESGVQRELRQRSRYTRRITRGQGGRREVLRRRLQYRMQLRQQKEQGSRIQWQEPLQLNSSQLEMLIKALKADAETETAAAAGEQQSAKEGESR
ncbi:hypothetical protein Efla_004146 [Eimeria flavescens]